MTKFYTAYGEKPTRKASCAGNRMEPHYVERYTPEGVPYLVKDGETNTYEKIQSYKMDCDVHQILQRYANGDASALSPRGVYADISQMPQSFGEMFNYLASQREKFDELPIEIRKEFGMSFERWAATAGSDEWLEKMGYNKKEEVKPVESEQ